MAPLTSQSQETAEEKQQKQYEARVKVLEIVVDINYQLTSLQDKCKRILYSVRGFGSDTPHQVRRKIINPLHYSLSQFIDR